MDNPLDELLTRIESLRKGLSEIVLTHASPVTFLRTPVSVTMLRAYTCYLGSRRGGSTALFNRIHPFTNGHCVRVSALSVQLGEQLGLSDSELHHLRWSALIHDIGKIGIPERILTKPGKLTDDEYRIVKQHPSLGAWALEGLYYADHVIRGVLSHHERWDGGGYPDGLKGDSIPLQGRIICVADVWDAITSDRPYRSALDRASSVKIMLEGRGTMFDPQILDAFFEVLHAIQERMPVTQNEQGISF
jgi:putative nucleotidyltransferase with HDIG domain